MALSTPTPAESVMTLREPDELGIVHDPSEKDLSSTRTPVEDEESGGKPIRLETTASTSQQAPYFPDGGYGWVVVGCMFATNLVTWGINSSFGVFLSFYVENDYFPGATQLQFAFVRDRHHLLAL